MRPNRPTDTRVPSRSCGPDHPARLSRQHRGPGRHGRFSGGGLAREGRAVLPSRGRTGPSAGTGPCATAVSARRSGAGREGDRPGRAEAWRASRAGSARGPPGRRAGRFRRTIPADSAQMRRNPLRISTKFELEFRRFPTRSPGAWAVGTVAGQGMQSARRGGASFVRTDLQLLGIRKRLIGRGCSQRGVAAGARLGCTRAGISRARSSRGPGAGGRRRTGPGRACEKGGCGGPCCGDPDRPPAGVPSESRRSIGSKQTTRARTGRDGSAGSRPAR